MTSTSSEPPKPPVPAGQRTGGKYIRWENGRPVPVYAQPLNKQQVSELVTAALSTEYEPEIDARTGEPINVDIKYIGMTKAEVMAMRLADKAAAGEDKATNQVLDRILGKPKQSVESVGVKMNYRDFLEMLEKDEAAQGKAEFEVGHTTVDVRATGIFDDDEDDDWL